MKLLLYCTKSKPYLIGRKYAPYKYYLDKGGKYSIMDSRDHIHNGKVVAECDFEVEKMGLDTGEGLIFDNGFNKESQLDLFEIAKYVGNNYYYAIHIRNLKIFNKPKELSDYYSIHNIGGMLLTDKLKKAPQNMQRVSIQEWEYGTMRSNDIAILISIRPEWLCKILNGEKTIEVRKKVLKRLLENDINLY